MRKLLFFAIVLIYNVTVLAARTVLPESGTHVTEKGTKDGVLRLPLYLHNRRKRYLGLSRTYKLNKRFQACVGPGDAEGHCKFPQYCQMDVLKSSRYALDHLCVIERSHVGVCCPDDIITSGLSGSRLIMDLPASGTDYEETDNTTGCGLSQSKSGKSTQRWPWIAGIYRPNEAHLFCAGAVVTEKHVLTAAHCTDGQKLPLLVRLGEYDFSRPDETRYLDFMVSRIVQHEEYSVNSYDNDIAVLVLEKPTSFNTYIWPICLPPLVASFENETATIAGWGKTAYDGTVSSVLLQVEVPVWSREQCEDAFTQVISEKTLCAGAYEGGKDSCKGDSGGPLVMQLENGRWVVVGVVSWGIGCGDKGRPGIYTRVNKYIPWIIKNTMTE